MLLHSVNSFASSFLYLIFAKLTHNAGYSCSLFILASFYSSIKAIPCDSESPALSGPTWGSRSLALGFTRWPRRQFTHGASSAMLVLKLALKVPPESSFPDFLKILPTQSPVESLCAQMSWSHYHLKQTLSQTSVQRSELHGTWGYKVYGTHTLKFPLCLLWSPQCPELPSRTAQ